MDYNHGEPSVKQTLIPKDVANLVHNLSSIQEEVQRVLEYLTGLPKFDGRAFIEGSIEPNYSRSLPEFAMRLWQARRRRGRTFSEDLFGEANWDILLYLYGEVNSRRISVKAVCLSAGVPTTTALRSINILINAGLVERQGDGSDRRQKNIRLSALGKIKMRRCLRDALKLPLDDEDMAD